MVGSARRNGCFNSFLPLANSWNNWWVTSPHCVGRCTLVVQVQSTYDSSFVGWPSLQPKSLVGEWNCNYRHSSWIRLGFAHCSFSMILHRMTWMKNLEQFNDTISGTIWIRTTLHQNKCHEQDELLTMSQYLWKTFTVLVGGPVEKWHAFLFIALHSQTLWILEKWSLTVLTLVCLLSDFLFHIFKHYNKSTLTPVSRNLLFLRLRRNSLNFAPTLKIQS